MAFVPILVMAASAAVAAYGAMSASRAQAASQKSEANAQRYNATVNQQNADAAGAAASANELAQRRTDAQRLGAIRAQIGSTGGGYTGTSLEVADQDASTMELDALNSRYRGQMEARGYLSAANMDQFKAQTADINASTDIRAGNIGAASAALSSFSNYSSYRGLNGGG